MSSLPGAARSTGAAAVLALIASCSNPNANASVVIATQVSPGTVLVGDSVSVIATVFVSGSKPVSVETNTCGGPFEVVDSRGQVVGPGLATPCLAVSIPIVVEPGGQYALQGYWTGLSHQSSDGKPVYVPPGEYRIRGKVTILERSTPVRGTLVGITLTGAG
ncbi:MAG: hypothetical protein MNPFHGCM_01419 [Gemmatimonadaceae bacterium]|nr:hypothetical protein [Gemmatimonadaceae bacterium]